MRFAFVEEHRHDIPVNRLCQIMDVSPRGYRAWRNRPVSASQRKDLVVLTHIRDQFEQSLGSYGSPTHDRGIEGAGTGRGPPPRWPTRCWSETLSAIDGVDGARFRHRNVPHWVL